LANIHITTQPTTTAIGFLTTAKLATCAQHKLAFHNHNEDHGPGYTPNGKAKAQLDHILINGK
jgi:hypothetical protein